MKLILRSFGMLSLLFILGGCGVADRVGNHLEHTWAGELFSNEEVVRVTVNGDEQLNPNVDGKPLSVVVRIYQLAEAETFRTASPRALWSSGDTLLGKQLLSQREFTVLPGQKKVDVSLLNPSAQFVGIAAFFRNAEDESWHMLFSANELKNDGLLSSAEGVHLHLVGDKMVVERGSNLLKVSDNLLSSIN